MDPAYLHRYYAAALEYEQKRRAREIHYSGEPVPTESDAGNILGFSATLAGLGLAGNIHIGQQRVWDYYLRGVRAFEEFFPGRIPVTLQMSNILSQFESVSRKTRIVTPDILKAVDAAGQSIWSLDDLEYLSRLTGRPVHELQTSGFRFQGQQLLLGTEATGPVILKNADIFRNVNQSGYFSQAYARSLGLNVPSSSTLFKKPLQYLDENGKIASEIFQIAGGNTRLENIKRQIFGYGTELVSRPNRLAAGMMDAPILGPILTGISKHTGLSLSVREGTGLQTLGRLVGKFGLGAGAAVMGYSYLDYLTRNTDLLNNTIFDKGITTGLATAWTKLNMGVATVSDITGFTEYGREQERIAPGSTSLTRLAAFPAIGALTGLGSAYIQRLAVAGRLMNRKRDLVTASNRAAQIIERFGDKDLIRRFGTYLKDSKSSIIRSLGKTRLTTTATIGAIAGLVPILPFLPGALAPENTPEELADIYSGRQEIAVRKGRWWEAGKTPWEGGAISYYRPHWYARMMAQSSDKGIWGNLEEQYGREISSLERWYIKNFTYELEEANFHERPYPVTGRAFYDVPIIGPILSATLGNIFKPPAMMHTEEFINAEGEYAQLARGFGTGVNLAGGEQVPGVPISPHSATGTIGEQTYRMMELVGLPGFIGGSVKKAVTGTETPYEDITQLQAADEMYGIERQYWDMQLGGLLGTSELLRRMIPHKRTQLDKYNPIRNTMPSWLPGVGDYSPDFQHGDPYTLVSEGELRLPGRGYAARYPELEGVAPEDYPLIHKYKILADVAPYSEKLDDIAAKVGAMYKANALTEEEARIYKITQEQLKAKKQKKEFSDYLYKEEKLNSVQEQLAAWNESQSEDTGPSWFERTVGSYWENLAHNVETPVEHLTPLAPASKLIHMRSPVEDYERMQVYGTEAGFWDKPWSNFIRPFLTSTARFLGDKRIPNHIEYQRRINEYFDILKYIKFSRLESVAKENYDATAAQEFETKKRETLFGNNPFGYSYTSIYRSLPKKDRDYYKAFSETRDQEERVRILELVPENEKGLYIAKWAQLDAGDYQKAVKAGILSAQEVEQGDKALQDLYETARNEGMPKTQDLWAEYLATRTKGETYPDWYRRTRLMAERLAQLGLELPGPDFVGFNPNIDLDDIKLEVVKNLGETIQDYDLWPSQERELRYKRAVINEETTAPITDILQSDNTDIAQIRAQVDNLLVENQITNLNLTVERSPNSTNNIDIDIQHDRSEELKRLKQRNRLTS